MGMIASDMVREFVLDVDAAGAVTIRKNGTRLSLTGGLPVFTTSTEEQAKRLQIRHCRLARDGSGTYYLNDPPKGVEDLGKVSDMFRATYATRAA